MVPAIVREQGMEVQCYRVREPRRSVYDQETWRCVREQLGVLTVFVTLRVRERERVCEYEDVRKSKCLSEMQTSKAALFKGYKLSIPALLFQS